jgi:hypothetical protein
MYVKGILEHRWKGNDKVDLKEIGCHGMDWIDLAQNSNQ